MSDWTIFIQMLVIIYLIFVINNMQKEHEKHVDYIHEMVGEERQKLIDRIQAPSFAEYKQAEVKVIKAQKDESPTERIELL